MFFKRNKKPPERYYLFPGMGGSAFRQKQRRFFLWSVAAALLGALLLTAGLYFMNTGPGHIH